MAETESFFLKMDETKCISDRQDALRLVLIRNLWISDTITEYTKRQVWLYFQVFIKLCEKYYNFAVKYIKIIYEIQYNGLDFSTSRFFFIIFLNNLYLN